MIVALIVIGQRICSEMCFLPHSIYWLQTLLERFIMIMFVYISQFIDIITCFLVNLLSSPPKASYPSASDILFAFCWVLIRLLAVFPHCIAHAD